ncbi:MAG: HPr family phosphocarrier protein [Bacteroidetes bacterium]|nr:HPr family phosphocarrier protein [Bacteroidota bacterium]
MIEADVQIKNNAGLHTRPAAAIVKMASRYKSEFYITKDGIEINGKSIIGVMTLAAEKGSWMKLTFDGADEEQAISEMKELFENGFGEL